MDKVRDGTPISRESLCLGCRNARIVKGLNFERIVHCIAFGQQSIQISFPVVECSAYDDKSLPPLYEMKEIAWVVKSRNRGPMGFTDGSTTEITVEPPDFHRYDVPTQQG